MSEKWLLKNASLINERAEVLSEMDLYIRDGKIEKICDTNQDNPGAIVRSSGTATEENPESKTSGAEAEKNPEAKASGASKENPDSLNAPYQVIDCSRFFVSCGLPNLHVHTAMNIFRGIAEDVTPDAWFNECIFPYESKMTPEDVYVGTKLGITEMIDNGVTVFADHYFGEAQVLRAVLEMGIRADIAPTVFGASVDYRDRLSQVVTFVKENRKISPLVSWHMGPHSDYNCPPDSIGDIADAAKALRLPIHLHVAEEEAQIRVAREKYGLTPFGYLDRYGVFDVPVLVAHGLWIQEEDLKYLRPDTIFAHCPKTYMKLGSGIGGFYQLADRLTFGFGTDGAASSNTLSPMEQARLFGLLEKYLNSDGTRWPAAEIWKRLMSGHQAFPFGTGRMEEGAPADLVIWDLDQTDTFPYYDPISAILYSSDRENVRYTMVNGSFLKYDGKLKEDASRLTAQGRELQRALIARGRGKANVSYLR